ncbi:C-type mannose receptor 2-like [Ptychodera flava]|uniref:C-type mannose receptor 2-like n=1 Tax=Ptychodera flava TaxID=63121 RepID=UPI00396A2CE1
MSETPRQQKGRLRAFTLCKCLIVGIFLQIDGSEGCDNPYGDHCYVIYPWKVSWRRALHSCQSFAYASLGQLADIRNVNENNHVKSIFGGYTKVWIGIHDLGEEGDFETVLHDAASFQNFAAPGEPNNNDPNKEDCVSMDTLGQWADEDCYAEYHPVCKMRADSKCDPVADPENGEVTPSSTTPEPMGTSLMFSCDPPLVLDGPRLITCQDGFWDRSPPICEACENQFNGYCYEVVPESYLSWSSAKSYCLDHFLGYPVDITSNSENNHVLSLFGDLPSTTDVVRIGIEKVDGDFKTVFGANAPYADWSYYQPDYYSSKVSISTYFDKWQTSDSYYDNQAATICKKSQDGSCVEVYVANGYVSDPVSPTFPVANGTTLSITCDDGYVVSNSATMLCTGGYWQTYQPQCIPLDIHQMRFGGSLYTVVSTKMNWHDSEDFCVNNNFGHLAVITDDEELYEVRLFKNPYVETEYSRPWIGINDLENDGVFATVHNETATFLPWYHSTQSPGSKCVGLSHLFQKIYDLTCTVPREFVCEKDGQYPDYPQFEHQGNLYTAVHTSRSWNRAEIFCQRNNFGHLAVFDNPDIATAVEAFSNAYLNGRFWIGLTDSAFENNFETVLGDPAPYLNWYSTSSYSYWGWSSVSEPDGGSSDDCVTMSNGEFYDDDCSDSRDFICKNEIPALPTTSATTAPSTTSATTAPPLTTVTSPAVFSISRNAAMRSGLFTLFANDAVVDGDPLQTTTVISTISCAQECLSHAECVSFTVQSSDVIEQKLCSLFTENYPESKLRPENGFLYFTSYWM